MKKYLQSLSLQQSLSFEEMERASEKLLQDQTELVEIAAFLIALRTKGETAEEIAGLVSILKKNANTFPVAYEDLIDICGTGGDGVGSFNISTASAFVLAGTGVPVAKHGNRSVSSKSGSTDVLEKLGIPATMSMKQQENLLRESNLTFLYAPTMHPRVKNIMRVRKQLKVPTIFNVIGPLTNPLAINYQLMGVFQQEYMPRIAEVLAKTEQKRSLLVHGAGGMDEASLLGENKCILIEKGETKSFTFQPEDIGLPRYTLAEIQGGNPEENAQILLNVLQGEKGAHLDTVLLNAGLALFTAQKVKDISAGIKMAKASVHSGEALKILKSVQQVAKTNQREVSI
ncbi:anthranilate phosphoribosyltransferase [Bacillus sp. 2205SS5-2]|uniref:anthranilate phosphoribosyltransferase n=1 Tax=Bacillus sp. 2205SS5-2 TaxID=3109031 RepID=UPI0030040045